ncbi:MAG TPA: ATP-dependent DNA helicase, partial [bacterium]|nr:ATP-dependent DNA helicase [bacterium]
FEPVREKKMFEKVRKWAMSTNTGDRAEMDFLPDSTSLWHQICSRRDECMGGRCAQYGACFLLKLRMKAQRANLVVANHHLFFADAALRRSNTVSALPDAQALIFDEAHQLDEIVTQFLGVHISAGEIDDFLKLVRRWKPTRKELGGETWGLTATLALVEEGARMFFRTFGSGEGRFELLEQYTDETGRMGNVLIERLEHLSAALDKEGYIPEEFTAEWKHLCFDLSGRIRFFMVHDEPGMAWWGERSSPGNTLHASPVDISGEFPAIIRTPVRPVVMTSATLTAGPSFDYFTGRLGIRGAVTAVYPSPFDYSTQGLLYLPDHLPEPSHPEFYEACAGEIKALLEASRGRAFVLTTSYSGLKQLRERLEDDLEYPLLVQGDAPKHRLIRDFVDDVHSVLLATISFWQGVDVPGDALSAVIIDKLPFSSPGDPIVRARIEHCNSSEGNAFMNYQLPGAIMMLKQGVGRLIRSRRDRGMVAILDHRILKRRYGRLFIQSLPPFRRASALTDVQEFFTEDSDPRN